MGLTSELTGDRRRGPERSEGPPLGVRVERPVRPQRTEVLHLNRASLRERGPSGDGVFLSPPGSWRGQRCLDSYAHSGSRSVRRTAPSRTWPGSPGAQDRHIGKVAPTCPHPSPRPQEVPSLPVAPRPNRSPHRPEVSGKWSKRTTSRSPRQRSLRGPKHGEQRPKAVANFCRSCANVPCGLTFRLRRAMNGGALNRVALEPGVRCHKLPIQYR